MNKKNYLKSLDGHSIFYECMGDKDGIPVIYLHGGPGSGCSESSKSFFDKKKWFSIFFDQRGCGLSKPSGGIQNNDIQYLIKDMELLRKKLGVKKWVIFGGSWGSTLALKYACEFPENVSALILRGIFLASEREIDWFLLGLKRFIPTDWDKFVHNIPSQDINSRIIINYYYETIFSENKEQSINAAKLWRKWEEAAMRLTYAHEATEEKKENHHKKMDEKVLTSMKVHLHYLKNKCFLKKDEIINKVKILEAIPTHIIQGQLDTICPPETSETLQKRMPWSFINRVKGAGHGAYEPPIRNALLDALKKVGRDFKR